MGFFDLFKNKPSAEKTTQVGGTYFETSISREDLIALTHTAIDIFQDNPDFNYNQIIDEIKKHCGDENLALALYRFIPIAYCRLLIPEPVYSDEYIVYKSEKDKKAYRLSADNVYAVVAEVSKQRFSSESSQDKIVSILVQSADFKAINDALTRGSELKDLVCAPSYFL